VHHDAPYVVPILFDRQGDRIYFATEPGQKLDDLKQNPNVCLEVDDVIPELGQYRSVVATGKAALVDDETERQAVLRRLVARHQQQGPRLTSAQDFPGRTMSKRHDAHLLVVAVTVESMTGRQQDWNV
jgi:nitroimidazol reductase NimA-like FMN-containing flavoprotein (pyridoxamine 5'-phosphate oxidase superfamily)